MTTYSETELATETLRSASLIGSDETPSAADLVDAKQSNASVVGAMAAIGIPIWNGSEVQVPQEYLVELAIRLSLPLRLKYGMIDESDYLSMVEASETRLTIMAAPRGSDPLTLSSNESTGRGWMPSTLSFPF